MANCCAGAATVNKYGVTVAVITFVTVVAFAGIVVFDYNCQYILIVDTYVGVEPAV
jgi:hypothetical protein